MSVMAAGSRRSSRRDERRGTLLATAAQMMNALGAGAISLNDIAARIGVPLGTVKSRLRLAMARLRTRFAEQA